MTCRDCRHPEAQHTTLSGCLAQPEDEGREFCPCAQFVPEEAPVADLAEGRRRRDEGTEAAGSGIAGALASAWRVKAAQAMASLAASGEEFSADDLVAIAGEPPVPNMLGAVFLAASRADQINAVGFTQAARPSARARVQRTWRGAR